MQATYERTTKIERMRKADGELVHLGDLVCYLWAEGTESEHLIEGEVVGFKSGKACIDMGEQYAAEHGQRYSHLYVNGLEVVVCKRG